MIQDIKQQTQSMETALSKILEQAKAKGATAAEVSVSYGLGLDVTVRLGEVETIEHNQGLAFDVTVYHGQRKGYASTSDTSDESISKVVDAALSIAEYTEEDDCSGLADPKNLATEQADLSLYHPQNISVDEAIVRAKECEDLARAGDSRVSNSEGASFAASESIYLYGNSNGFVGHYPTSRFSLDCSLIGQQDGDMQRDYGYSTARDLADLWTAKKVADEAVERTVSKLGARKLKTGKYPVIYKADCARSLIWHGISAISGGALYRHQSFMEDGLGKVWFPEWFSITDDPFVQKGFGSSPFDGEGVQVQKRQLVEAGVLQGYLLGSYSARKLGLQTTGNAGGAHNISVATSDASLKALLQQMGTGLLVTDLMGDGVSITTGDYSRGANGFWVENGELQYPVEEITVASNLKDIFSGFVSIGSDIDPRSSLSTGSILIEEMMVAGS